MVQYMCGRYASAKDPDALIEEFEVEESLVEKPLYADYNVAPTKQVYTVLSQRASEAPEDAAAQRQLRVVRWGLVPSWAKDPSIGSRMINARAETVAEKPSFRRAFGKRRCILPADGYYEWYTPTGDNVPLTARGKPVKQPFYIHRADGRSLAMAGLYEWWHDKSKERDDPEGWLITATIITTSATDAVGRIHDRMPVVIGAADWERWLDPAVGQRELLEELMVPAQTSPLAAYPVSVQVNSVRNNGPELVEPLPLDEAAPGTIDADGLRPPAEA